MDKLRVVLGWKNFVVYSKRTCIHVSRLVNGRVRNGGTVEAACWFRVV